MKSGHHDTIKKNFLEAFDLSRIEKYSKEIYSRGNRIQLSKSAYIKMVFYISKGKVKVVSGDNSSILSEGDYFSLIENNRTNFDFIEDTEMIYFNLEDYQ